MSRVYTSVHMYGKVKYLNFFNARNINILFFITYKIIHFFVRNINLCVNEISYLSKKKYEIIYIIFVHQ